MGSEARVRFEAMLGEVESRSVGDWTEISSCLDTASSFAPSSGELTRERFAELVETGAAFYTFDYGIDGVSIEIKKYAQSLEDIFAASSGRSLPLHFIGGDFHEGADIVLKPDWKRFRIEGMNGWSKWMDGEWFARLYYEDMPEGSHVSRGVAREIWRQTLRLARELGGYLAENDISLVIPLNIPSNPGNLPAEIALVLVSEMMGLHVLSSNHDFYWEGGMPAAERPQGKGAGPRDHFFRNVDNAPFFSLFRRVYPWNGRRWIQVNINSLQSRTLIERFGFERGRVFELGTSVSDKFFGEFTPEDRRECRRKMAYILSDGEPVVATTGIREHLGGLGDWMKNQRPVALGAKSGLRFDPAGEKTIYCLQPTRVIARKRIERDFHLLHALLHCSDFRDPFAADAERQLVVHISGPVPMDMLFSLVLHLF